MILKPFATKSIRLECCKVFFPVGSGFALPKGYEFSVTAVGEGFPSNYIQFSIFLTPWPSATVFESTALS